MFKLKSIFNLILQQSLIPIILIVVFANCTILAVHITTAVVDVDLLNLSHDEMNESKESNRSFPLQSYESIEKSVRLLDYFRNKRKDPECNPEKNIYQCGTLEFLGCSGNKKFYSQAIIKLNWFEAWEFCRSNGMYLASIESNYEQVFMELFLSKPETNTKEGYWLSGTDFGREGLFFWMTNGHSFTFTNWRLGEPNNFRGQEHCVQMTATTLDHDTMRWNDMSCHLVAYAVCQEDYVQNNGNKLPDRVASVMSEKLTSVVNSDYSGTGLGEIDYYKPVGIKVSKYFPFELAVALFPVLAIPVFMVIISILFTSVI